MNAFLSIIIRLFSIVVLAPRFFDDDTFCRPYVLAGNSITDEVPLDEMLPVESSIRALMDIRSSVNI